MVNDLYHDLATDQMVMAHQRGGHAVHDPGNVTRMNRRLKFTPILIVVAIAVLVLSACSGSGTPPSTIGDGPVVTTEAPSTTETPQTTEAPAPTDAPSEGTVAPSDDTGESTNSDTSLYVLLGIAVIVIIGLLAWLVGRNSASANASQQNAQQQSPPMPPPAQTAPPEHDNVAPDDEGNDTGSPTDPDPSSV
jgi:flagellar basal body-associated protein FliL